MWGSTPSDRPISAKTIGATALWPAGSSTACLPACGGQRQRPRRHHGAGGERRDGPMVAACTLRLSSPCFADAPEESAAGCLRRVPLTATTE